MSNETFSSIWDAIEDTQEGTANMKLRASLMMALQEQVSSESLSQIEAAKTFGITQPRVSDLMRGKIGLFALDTLVNMLAVAGLQVEMHVSKAA